MLRALSLVALALLVTAEIAPTADTPKKRTPREGLQAFHNLIGSWRGAGMPSTGTRVDREKNAWQEGIAWEWQFKGDDVWLSVVFEKSKYFLDGQLRYAPDKDAYEMKLQTPAKEAVVFEGKVKDHVLTLERTDEAKKETQRLVFTFLHSNRHLYHYEVKPKEKTLYSRLYQVGATKEGEPFAVAPGTTGPECIVSGGPAATAVTYKGQTYYVCCSGCRSEFNANPEKFIKEYEEMKAKKEKK